MKTCTKCGEEKSLEDFRRHPQMKDGRRPDCKVCQSAQQKVYAAKNAGAYRRRAREWARKNPERVKEQTRQKWEADPERYAGYVRDGIRRRRARLADLFVADVREAEIILRDQGVCGICAEPVMGPLHLDHIVPVAAGGTHEPDNIQLAHPTCNQRKGASLPA